MINIEIITQWEIMKWLFMASCIYGLFRLVKLLIINK